MTDDYQTPGEAIKAEMERRGWNQADLALILGRHRPEISHLLRGVRGVSPEMAVRLSAALGHTPEYWLRLDAGRQLSTTPREVAESVRKRARLYDLAPIKEMQRRGWLDETDDMEELERDILGFYGLRDLTSDPVIGLSARKRDAPAPLSKEQRAWAFRAKQIASAFPTPAYDERSTDKLIAKLRRLAAYAEEARHVARVMAEAGIRLVVVEPLAGGSIDGAAFWLDERTPVVVLSLRFDRIDAFWFTLLHEVEHIRNRDAWSIDVDLVGDRSRTSVDEIEQRANEGAAANLIPREEIESFIRRVSPLYSKERIVQFAHRMQIHPGIVVGQLQNRGEIKYSANREMLAKIRGPVLSTAIADGWGQSVGMI